MKYFSGLKTICRATVVAGIMLGVAASSASAQRSVRHALIRGDMPPGLAAEYYRMSNPALEGHEQPVRIVTPLGARVEVASQKGYTRMDSSRVSIGVMIGPVYRFKVTNIPRHFGKELYPSIEILDRLNPPTGMENEFPVQIVVTKDDLNQAIEGRLVTKVIYLENPETALPHRHQADDQPYFDVGGGEDPLRAAETLGRPMAILRIGSRVPMPSDLTGEFTFHAPTPTLLPDPQTNLPAPQREMFDEVPAEGPPTIKKGEFIPNTIEAADRARRTSHNAQDRINFSNTSEFTLRGVTVTDIVYPTPLGYGKQIYGVPQNNSASKMSTPGCTPGYKGWNPNAHRDEYVFDGHDRGEKVYVDQSWNVHGLQTEDTIGHFDTLNGNRVVTPSNRVAIYAPRFGAVRKVDGVFGAKFNQPVLAYEEKIPIASAAGNDGANTTKQHLALNHHAGSKRASGFTDRTRGVVSDTVTHLFGARNSFKAFENLSLMRIGKWSNAESARVDLGIQSALVWEDDLGLQVVTKKISPVIVRDVKSLEAMVAIDSEDGADMFRVTKIASRIAARTGEHVEFTIRYDNLSNEKIGNVTIIDNLTRRLEYVPDSAESSLKADFISKRNDGGSLMLRWEIIEPMEPHTGGIIRFKCRVR